MSRRKYCPACGTRMEAERTTHRTVNAQGRPVLYYNVWKYDCPQGCATTTYDFSEASLDPEGRARAYRLVTAGAPQGDVAVAAPSLLDRLDLSFLITVLGLILGYCMFAWALIIIPASPMGKIVTAAAFTLGAFYVVVHMTTAPKREPSAAVAVAAGEAPDVESPAAVGDGDPEKPAE